MSKSFLILIAVAAGIRLAFVFFAFSTMDLSDQPKFDGDGYLIEAGDFRRGNFYFSPDRLRRMPLYPALCAFWGTLIGSEIYTMRLWHVGLDLTTLACVYLFVKRFFGEKPALAAGALYSLYPLAVFRLIYMSTEVIVSTLLGFWMLGAVKCSESFKTRDVILLSFLTTLILYINPAFLFIPPLCILALFFFLPAKSAIRLGLIFLTPILVFTLLWGVRNYAVTGTFNLFDSRGGKEFWVGNHQSTDGRWEGPGREVWFKELEQYGSIVSRQGGNVFDMNRYMYRQGIREILSNPSGATILFVKKFFRFWYVPASETMLSLTIPLQSFYLLLAVAGVIWGSRQNRGMRLAVFVIAYYCGIYTLSYACIRFSHPIMPWVCALGGVGIMQGWNRFPGGALWQRK